MTTGPLPLRTVLWRRNDDLPGHEVGALTQVADGWRLSGTVVMAAGEEPCALVYTVDIDADWRTRGAWVSGGIGARRVGAMILRSADGVWSLNGQEVPAVAGCVDVDLSFTPCTNLLPIRRLDLAVGDEAPVRAAWLRFPQMTLEPLEQRYQRTGQREYRYESGGGAFTAALEVDELGLVARYADIWSAEASA